MDKQLKKDIGYLLLSILGGVGVLISDLLPTLNISGPWLIFLLLVSGALGVFLEKLIKRETGIPIEEEEEISIDTTADP